MRKDYLLPLQIIADRINRYAYTNEPLRLIAQDHGVDETAIIRTAERHAPWAVGMRTRGGGRREWPA